ncbi:hypothetical protein R3P38DRAFT_2771221 [Favolaschia claudopus]|uniref:Uncharacterized protein n=1 Tax=Favolaschia claudopus TaxID=2862362 RepID=A0AAW0C9E8_9AGAR
MSEYLPPQEIERLLHEIIGFSEQNHFSNAKLDAFRRLNHETDLLVDLAKDFKDVAGKILSGERPLLPQTIDNALDWKLTFCRQILEDAALRLPSTVGDAPQFEDEQGVPNLRLMKAEYPKNYRAGEGKHYARMVIFRHPDLEPFHRKWRVPNSESLECEQYHPFYSDWQHFKIYVPNSGGYRSASGVLDLEQHGRIFILRLKKLTRSQCPGIADWEARADQSADIQATRKGNPSLPEDASSPLPPSSPPPPSSPSPPPSSPASPPPAVSRNDDDAIKRGSSREAAEIQSDSESQLAKKQPSAPPSPPPAVSGNDDTSTEVKRRSSHDAAESRPAKKQRTLAPALEQPRPREMSVEIVGDIPPTTPEPARRNRNNARRGTKARPILIWLEGVLSYTAAHLSTAMRDRRFRPIHLDLLGRQEAKIPHWLCRWLVTLDKELGYHSIQDCHGSCLATQGFGWMGMYLTTARQVFSRYSAAWAGDGMSASQTIELITAGEKHIGKGGG